MNHHPVVVALDKILNREFERLEIEQHVVCVELWSCNYDLDGSRVAVRKAALLWMLAEHVPAFDHELLTNSVKRGAHWSLRLY